MAHANVLDLSTLEKCIPSEVELFFTVESIPSSHWCEKSPPMLRHKLNYLINVSLHLHFQPGLILELGIRLIMDLVGQK